MNIDEIKANVQNELNEATVHKNEIQKLIVEPSKAVFESMDGVDRELWTIGQKEEYCIVYDESNGMYGLAFKNIVNLMVYLGSDGSLSDAYDTLISREDALDSDAPRSKKNDTRKRWDSRPTRSRS
jgi:hypothetical protein